MLLPVGRTIDDPLDRGANSALFTIESLLYVLLADPSAAYCKNYKPGLTTQINVQILRIC